MLGDDHGPVVTEVAATTVDAASFLAGDDEETRTSTEIAVLACNWSTVMLYQQASLAYAGMGACIGLTAQEIESVLTTHQVKPKRRPRMATHLRLMGAVQAHIINARAERARTQGGKR